MARKINGGSRGKPDKSNLTSRRQMITPTAALTYDLGAVRQAQMWLSRVSLATADQTSEYITTRNFEFSGFVGAAQVLWRRGDDPREYVEQGLATSFEAADVYRKLRKKREENSYAHFAFGIACQFAFLLYSEFPNELIRELPAVSFWRKQSHAVYLCADAGLVHAMLKGRRPRGWSELMNLAFRNQRKLTLFPDSFDCYMEIILNVAKHQFDAVPQLVQRADKLFHDRGCDETYREFDLRDGGGRYANVRIDYRLATILKWAIGDRTKQNLATIHKWSFS